MIVILGMERCNVNVIMTCPRIPYTIVNNLKYDSSNVTMIPCPKAR